MRLDPIASAERLASARFGVLGTVDPQRGTHLVPVVFALLDGHVVIPIDAVKPKSGALLRRLANLDVDPRASLLVDHRSEDWSELWWVRADLHAVATDDDGPARAALAARYEPYRDPASVPSILTLRIDHITGWSAADR